jgi:hypothetical protein
MGGLRIAAGIVADCRPRIAEFAIRNPQSAILN